jgi:hypothetical protein
MLRRPTFLGIVDLNWWERREADAIDAIEASQLADSAAIARLQGQVQQLAMALAASVKVISDLVGADVDEVERRIVAEIDAMKPAPAPATVANPKKASVPDVAVICGRCGQAVSSTRTTITERGTLCDACAGV